MIFLLLLLSIPAFAIDLSSVTCSKNPTLPYCNDQAATTTEGSQEDGANTADRQVLMARMRQMHSRRRLAPLHNVLSVPDDVRKHLAEIAQGVDRGKRNPFDDEESGHTGNTRSTSTTTESATRSDFDRDPILKEKESGEDEEALKAKIAESDALAEELALAVKSRHQEKNEEPGGSGSDASARPVGLVFHGDKEEYCDKYKEHYSYYCVGEKEDEQRVKEVIASFCPNYRKSCGTPFIPPPPPPPTSSSSSSSSSSSQQTWPANPFEKEIVVLPSSSLSLEELKELKEKQIKEKQLEALKKLFPCKPECDRRIHPHCTAECKCDYIYPTVQRFCNPPPLPFFLNTCRLWYYGCPKYEKYHYASQFIYSKAAKGKTLGGQPKNTNPYGIPPPAIPLPVAQGSRTATPDRKPAGFIPQNELITNDEGALVIPPPLPNNRRRVKDEPAGQSKKESYFELPRGFSADLTAGGAKALQSLTSVPAVPSDAATSLATGDEFHAFDHLTNEQGLERRGRSRDPFAKPGLWTANPDNPHNRDHANKWWYDPGSVGVDWLSGQAQWGRHFAVPAAGVGGSNGYSTLFWPSIGTFLNIPDDYE